MGCCGANLEEMGEPDAFYPIRAECRDDVPNTRFKPRHGKTLSARRWHASFSEDGNLDIAKVLRRIQRGGVHPTIKGVVWEFLLGCYDPKSSFDDRSTLRQNRRSEYEKLKSKCKEMEKAVGSGVVITAPLITEDGQPIAYPASNGATFQENIPSDTIDSSNLEREANNEPLDKEVIQWKLTLHQIGLDVVRTDRALVYYENQQNQARLWDILAVYSWMDQDIGYCQGMSDLCSPISILLENEADAFWCFERLMRRLRGNFKATSTTIGVRSQLSLLSSIVKAVDPKLHEHIENLDGGEYLFAFRMLMVLFRREFSFVDSLYLWELLWSMEYNPNLFSTYETESDAAANNKSQEAIGDPTLLTQYGKFERKNIKAGQKDHQATLSIFLVASVLEAKNKRLLKEAKGLDDVVQILNDITGNLDAKKACDEALKIHQKYLNKTKVS
ncbi:TBC1 domain family member 15 [Ananas comosus]|uniref:TBC1 domain family member 15 n=1 Tax=Ananas comosus TaxID=4615 RepID=A0A6P5H2J1_ANACO|nr:TBC1 domain family member 15 [Ananas comosus]XP_020115157.1 TBC1 domain family member 15 [Ananas comosus]XP_020115158.1 TBC1 domain family member 15 [Ananas comosus]